MSRLEFTCFIALDFVAVDGMLEPVFHYWFLLIETSQVVLFTKIL